MISTNRELAGNRVDDVENCVFRASQLSPFVLMDEFGLRK